MKTQTKSIIITGAAGCGVALGIRSALKKQGIKLILVDIDEQSLASCAEDGDIIVGDICDTATIQRTLNHIEQSQYTLYGLVNNAGIGLSKPPHEASEAEFDKLYNVDIKAVWAWSSAFVDYMLKKQLYGSIVNISSVHAHSTIKRYAIYAGSKAWVEGFTRGFAVEYGSYGIRCNAVAPGYVHSDQNLALISTWAKDPMAWVREHSTDQQSLPNEIEAIDCGHAVAWLLSEEAKSVSGQTLRVDAGSTAMLYNNSFLK